MAAAPVVGAVVGTALWEPPEVQATAVTSDTTVKASRWRPGLPITKATVAAIGAATGCSTVPWMTEKLRLASYAEIEADRIVATLFDWLRIPSISADPDRAGDVRSSAEFCAQLLRDAGLEHVAIIDPDAADGADSPDGAERTNAGPAVYGDWLHAGADAPTVLVYGHHDVQPVDPVELWTSPPFSPVIVDGECRARGAVDDKGQTLYQIEAARGLLTAGGALPVNLKFIIEGEEEIGSPHFEGLLAREAQRLACDVIVVSDTDMLAPDVPSITVGMRGLVAFDVDIVTSTTDLHSGTWGGTVPNAALAAAQLAAALHDARAGSPCRVSTTVCGRCRPPSRRPWPLNHSTRACS